MKYKFAFMCEARFTCEAYFTCPQGKFHGKSARKRAFSISPSVFCYAKSTSLIRWRQDSGTSLVCSFKRQIVKRFRLFSCKS